MEDLRKPWMRGKENTEEWTLELCTDEESGVVDHSLQATVAKGTWLECVNFMLEHGCEPPIISPAQERADQWQKEQEDAEYPGRHLQ